MNKSPAFQFYAQDFLTGIVFLTNEEVGIYIKLLSKQWTDNRIPKKRLGLFIGYEWEDLSDELKSKFKDEGEYVINKRLEEERDKQFARIKAARENGKKGGRPPKNKNPNKSQSKAKKSFSHEDEDRSIDKGGVGEKEKTDILEGYKNKIKDEGITEWMESIYMQFKLKPKSLSKVMDDFISHIKCQPKPPPDSLQDFKSYFYNWCNRVDPEGKLNKYKKNTPKQVGAL